LTGYEIGLVAIVVGFMVGGAVRKGCDGRGGWFYQAMAMFLTYSSIVVTYIPPILEAVRESETQQATSAGVESATGRAAEESVEGGAGESSDSASGEAAVLSGIPSWLRFVIAAGFLFAIAFVAPFLAGAQNIIGLLIIGFAVFEAWKINKRPVLNITGPHALAAAAMPVPPPALDAGPSPIDASPEDTGERV